ncbi:hypothetical protein GCM10010170_078430 [Dactylosporangium salmoneum]|uniref:Uncharacterized protein n=1 Tax=Dactylosporangium salmoneum TaxID=53361 RepID=A0ABP5UBM5_9ACTN
MVVQPAQQRAVAVGEPELDAQDGIIHDGSHPTGDPEAEGLSQYIGRPVTAAVTCGVS